MKKHFVLLLTLAAFAFGRATAQIDAPADSIPTLLCKTWRVSYALMGTMQIAMKPGVQAMDCEFKKDKTFTMSSGSTGSKGTWAYDPATRTIKLTVNGKSNTTVVQLQTGQLTMSVDTKEATPDDPTEIKLVYKVKTD
jgi:hypothetical protein